MCDAHGMLWPCLCNIIRLIQRMWVERCADPDTLWSNFRKSRVGSGPHIVSCCLRTECVHHLKHLLTCIFQRTSNKNWCANTFVYLPFGIVLFLENRSFAFSSIVFKSTAQRTYPSVIGCLFTKNFRSSWMHWVLDCYCTAVRHCLAPAPAPAPASHTYYAWKTHMRTGCQAYWLTRIRRKYNIN